MKLPNILHHEHPSLPAILCVDDEAILTLTLKNDLKRNLKFKAYIETACDGYEALDILDTLYKRGVKIIVMITDIIMPRMNGLELSSIVKEKYPDINIIVISAYFHTDIFPTIDMSIFHTLMEKPWNMKKLIDTVNTLYLEFCHKHYNSDCPNDLITK